MKPRLTRFRFRAIDNSGQSSSEYIIVVILIAIALVAALKFADRSIKCKFDLAFSQMIVGYQVPAQCRELIVDRDEEAEPNPFAPIPINNFFEPPAPPQPPTPPTPPAPPSPPLPPGNDPVRHHVGDGNCAANLCGGGLTNEGVTYSKTFSVDTEALQEAGITGIKIVFLANGIDSPLYDTVALNGTTLGNISNGYNEYSVSTASLLNTNTLTINSQLAPWSGSYDHDDFEFWDISITWLD